ncbi:flavin reductase family protein [Actinosynnema sp. NPDC020468]|uniref:flavin reductase family protein n=1 Tax=Actinosynnema sp. NPDC020468 TaxID=3154488 RepID=UPI0033E0B37C
MSAFPTGVAVVTANGDDDQPVGATCSSLASVSLAPLVLLVCLREGRTLDAVVNSGRFAVNLLRASGRGAARLFAAPAADKFTKIRWSAWGQDGLPRLLDDAFATAGCRLRRTVEMGDHTVVFGEVREIRHRTGVPLLYGLRKFSSWPTTDLDAAAAPARADQDGGPR